MASAGAWGRSGVALLAVSFVAACLAVGLAALPVLAAEPSFGTPTIEGSMGEGLRVTQPVTLTEAPARVELLLTYADDPAPIVIESVIPALPPTGKATLREEILPPDGHLLPNTPISARWRLTDEAGATVLGPVVQTVYADKRFEWQSVTGDIVRVHWYEGDAAFGARALRIGEQAIADTSKLLGVTETEPIDFFIYADQQAFYDALGPGTRENVGGQANAGIRTLFALITPSAIDDPWVGVVIPHELVHLVFDTAVKNPYHFPPRWLNEGLAVYLTQGYDPTDRGTVEGAAQDGTLIPLDGLGGQFPTSAERFSQAYAESVSAVDFLIREHGQDTLVSLIGSYADGRTDDEAFQGAIGMDVAGFNDAWLAELGAQAPVRYGPQPAPEAPGVPGVVPGPTDEDPAAAGPPALLIAAAVAVLAVAAAVILYRARRRRPPLLPTAEPGLDPPA